MIKPFNKAITPLAVSCALLGFSSHALAGDPAAKTNHTPVPALQQAEYGAGLIVKYKDSNTVQKQTQASSKAMNRVNATINAQSGAQAKHHRFNAFGSQVLKFDRPQSVQSLEKMAAKLSAQPGVEFVEVDRYMYPLATANDTHYGVQWHYTDPTAGIDVEAAWDVTQGAGATVAVIDTGYTQHSDLVANIVGGYDFVSNSSNARDGNGRDSDASDEGDWVASANECYQGSPASNSSWHGTHVAGTIAAVTNNNKGVAGIAYQSKVVPIRVLAKCGGTTSDIADAIVWAAGGSVSGVPANPNPAQVINMSLGGTGACSSTSQNAINSARSNGAVVIVASGNSNANVSGHNPGNCNGVISVAATNNNADRASYSNYGSLIDIAAPGGEGGSGGVASTMNSGTTTPSSENYAYNAGTSMAAPHVAGVAALMFAVNPNLTPDEVEQTIKSSARPFPSGSSCNTSNCGDGLLDAPGAVAAAQGGGNPPPPPSGNELDNGVAISLSGASGSVKEYTFDVPAGASTADFVMSGGSGDADLYVKFGSAPTTSSYDCRPYKNGNSETCSVTAQTGTYYVMVRGYSSYSNASLIASHDGNSSNPPPASGGSESITDVSGASGSWSHYYLDVPAGMSSLDVQMSGGSGDADLYVRRGTQPTTSAYDCRPYKNGNNESCSVSNPAEDRYYISVRGYSAFSGVTLDINWE